ncbi:MAG: SurA N-terminal domain-containing protein, partial [Clostridia bacterium]|nr:SurA N-terminal domain-containing protein [Clostridia bacterium]
MKHGKIFMRVAVFLLSALLLFSFSSCSVSGQLHASPRAGKTVAKAGNVKILYEELYYFAMNKRAEMVAEEGEHVFDDPEKRTELENFVWEKLLTRETALRSVGEDYGLSVYDGELSDNVKKDIDALVRENYNGDRKTYVRALEEGYLTDHYLRMIVGVSDYLSASIVLNMMKRGEVDTSDEAVWKAARSS